MVMHDCSIQRLLYDTLLIAVQVTIDLLLYGNSLRIRPNEPARQVNLPM